MKFWGVGLSRLCEATRKAIPNVVESAIAYIIQNCSDYNQIIQQYENDIDIDDDIEAIARDNDIPYDDSTTPPRVFRILMEYIAAIPDHLLIDANFLGVRMIKNVDQAKQFTKSLPFVNQALFSRLVAFFVVLRKKLKGKKQHERILHIMSTILIREPKTNEIVVTQQIADIFLSNYDAVFVKHVALNEDGRWISKDVFQSFLEEEMNKYLASQTMSISHSMSDNKLNQKRSKSLHNLKAEDQGEFIANEEEDDENDGFLLNSKDKIQISARQRDYSINYQESDVEEGYIEEEDGADLNDEGFQEEEETSDYDETIFDNIGEGNGKIDRIILSREVGGAMEYLITMQGTNYPFAQWIPLTILMEIPNYKSALTRFNDNENKFPFYVAEKYTFSTSWDSPLHIVAHKQMESGQTMYLLQYTCTPGTAYYWEVRGELSPNNLIDYYNNKQVSIVKEIPARPTVIPSIQPNELENFKSKSGYLPKEYQRTGVNWLLQCFCDQHGSLLADEMGLGKTIQAITFLRKLRDIGWEGPHIIVVRNNTYNQWCQELEEWSDFNYVMYKGDPNDRLILRTFRIHHDKEGKFRFNILLVAYDILIKDYEFFKNINFEVMIIDEGHRIKQRYGQTHLAFDTLKAQHRIIMTGTPIQNTLQELWSLLNFVSPEHFDDPDLFPDEEVDSMEPTKMRELRDMITPHLMRRSLDEVEKSIVPKDERFVFLQLSQAQKDLTKLVKLHELWRIQGQERDNYQESQMLHRICNHPFMVEGYEQYITELCGIPRQQALVETCCKFQFLDLILPIFKRQNRSVLIFSQRIKILQLLAEYCQLRKYRYVMLDGQLSADDKKVAIDSFVSDDSDVFIFLISTKSGAEGLNLTKASVTIIFDPDWNPNNDLQALGRCHRIGQTKRVLVLRLITFGTYEHSMYTRAQKKLKLWDAVLGESDLHSRIKLIRRRTNQMMIKPYTPIHFSVTEKQAEMEEPKESIIQPPELPGLKFEADASLEDVLNGATTVVTDLLKYKDQKEIDWGQGENVDEFLKKFVLLDDVNVMNRRKKKTQSAYQIDLSTARKLVSSLERNGFGQYEAIQASAVPDCPIDTVKKFCIDSIVLFFRALESTGFLQFPILAQQVLIEKNAPISLLMCPERDEWLSVPFTRRGSVVVSLKQLFSSIHRTAPYFLYSLESKLIVKKFFELGLQFRFDDILPAPLTQQIPDEQIIQTLVNNEQIVDENRSHIIVTQMKRQIIEQENSIHTVVTPLWGRPEINNVLTLLKNFGAKVLKMPAKEIQWRTGIMSKVDHTIKVLATKILSSLKVSVDSVLPLRIPSTATGSQPDTSQQQPFPETFSVDAREMLSVTRRAGIMTAIDLALQKVPDDDKLFQGDNKEWFTNHHFCLILRQFNIYGFDSLSNILISNKEFSDNLKETDIPMIALGNDLMIDTKVPNFLLDESVLLGLMTDIIGRNPLELTKDAVTQYKAEQELIQKSRPQLDRTHTHKGLNRERLVKVKLGAHLKITMPRITELRFNDGRKDDEMKREVDKAAVRFKRNIPVDERRTILSLLQGKPPV